MTPRKGKLHDVSLPTGTRARAIDHTHVDVADLDDYTPVPPVPPERLVDDVTRTRIKYYAGIAIAVLLAVQEILDQLGAL